MRFRWHIAALVVFVLMIAASANAAMIGDEDFDPMFAIREGWAWPVVVIPPPGGWDSPEGLSVKYAMRMAERALSRERGAIRGKELVFLFSSINDAGEVAERLKQWRGMDAAAIVSFGGGKIDQTLQYLCRDRGPAVVFCAGEELKLIDPTTRAPYKYLFALDLHYYARSNAIADAGVSLTAQARSAVISDMMSSKLALGARLTRELLISRGVDTLNVSVPAYRQDHFLSQVRDLESGNVRFLSVWLDAMATLSIWRTANISRNGTVVCYAGGQHPILLDADGLIIVDKESPLERNAEGIKGVVTMLRDSFDRVPDDPVMAAKGYCLAKWVIDAYRRALDVRSSSIAETLADSKGLPLMDDEISIDPNTHRPETRKFGVLMVEDRQYKSHGIVEIYSREVDEGNE